VQSAQRALSAIIGILILMLAGIAWLARVYHIGASDPGMPGYESLLSQLPTMSNDGTHDSAGLRQLGPGATGLVSLRRLIHASVWSGLPWAPPGSQPEKSS